MIHVRKQQAAAACLLRSLQLGDHWHYQVSGQLTRPDIAAPLDLLGTILVTVVPDTLLDHPRSVMLSFVQALEVAAADGTFAPFPAPDLMFSFVQDPVTRDAAIVADNMGRNGACRRAATPRIFYPGCWRPGTRYDNRLEFGDGDFVRNTLLVTGQAMIDTPLGRFPTWVAEITSESPLMGKISGIDWWAPELGAPACFETAATLPDGITTRIRARLNRTNVVPEPIESGERR